jgi:hypothetical protein
VGTCRSEFRSGSCIHEFVQDRHIELLRRPGQEPSQIGLTVNILSQCMSHMQFVHNFVPNAAYGVNAGKSKLMLKANVGVED